MALSRRVSVRAESIGATFASEHDLAYIEKQDGRAVDIGFDCRSVNALSDHLALLVHLKLECWAVKVSDVEEPLGFHFTSTCQIAHHY